MRHCINGIAAHKTFSDKTYNLGGMEVRDGYRGVVIQNGKKVLRK